RRGEQAVEPAPLDVAREVDAGRRPGEARALEHADREDEALVAVRPEAAEVCEVAEYGAEAAEEDRGREDAGNRRPGHPEDLVHRPADQNPDGGQVGGEAHQPTLSLRLRASALRAVESAPTSRIAPNAFS